MKKHKVKRKRTNHSVSRNKNRVSACTTYSSSVKNMKIYLLYFWCWLFIAPFTIIHLKSLPLDLLLVFTTASLIITLIFVMYQKLFGIQKITCNRDNLVIERSNRRISFCSDEILRIETVPHTVHRLPYSPVTLHLKNSEEYAISDIGFNLGDMGEIYTKLCGYTSK